MPRGLEYATVDLLPTTMTRASKAREVALFAEGHAPMLLVWNAPQVLTTAVRLASKAIPMPLVPKCLNYCTSVDCFLAAWADTQVLPLCLHWGFACSNGWWTCSHTFDKLLFIIFIVHGKLDNTACTKGLVLTHAHTCNLVGWVIDAHAMATA